MRTQAIRWGGLLKINLDRFKSPVNAQNLSSFIADTLGTGHSQFQGHDIFVGYSGNTLTVSSGAGPQKVDAQILKQIREKTRSLEYCKPLPYKLYTDPQYGALPSETPSGVCPVLVPDTLSAEPAYTAYYQSKTGRIQSIEDLHLQTEPA